MKKLNALLLALALTFSGGAPAATFNLFSPATGILKGNASSYITTAAVANDVISLWSGTCNASTFLRADGSCQAATTAPAGSDTQVQFNDGGVFGGSGNFTWNDFSLQVITPAGLTPGVIVRGNAAGAPIYEWNDQGVAANGRRWWALASGSFQIFAVDDAGTPGQIGLQIDRTSGTSNITRSLLAAGAGSTLGISSTGEVRVNGSAGSAGNVLTSGGIGAAASWASISTTPAGADTQIQYNDAGAFGASSNLTWNNATSAFAVAGSSISLTGTFGTKFQIATGVPTIEGGGNVNINAGTLGLGDLLIDTSGAVVLTTNGTVTIDGSAVCRASGTGCPAAVSPGGSTTQVQYNNAGAFGGDAGMTYNAGTDTLTVGSIVGNGSGLSSLDAGDISAGTLLVARGGTGATTLTGVVKGNGASAFTAGTVALASEVSGTLPVANGGTGVTSSTGSGSVVLSASPTLTGTATVATLAATAATVGGSNVCRQDGTNCPAAGGGAAYAVIAVGGAACSVSGSYESSGIASCTYNAAGSFNVNLSTGTGLNPACTVTLFGTATSAKIATVNGVDADTIGVGIYSLTNAVPITWSASDNSFSIHCISN